MSQVPGGLQMYSVFMPLTSRKLEGHIALGLSVCPRVGLFVCMSVTFF